MNYSFYNYMLIVQQEVLKAVIKKSLNIGYQRDTENKVLFLADPTGQSCFCIPENLFILDTSKLKEMSSLVDMYHTAAISGHSIKVTADIVQQGKTTQLRKLYDPENNVTIWINNKFLGYFKNNKDVMYNYFEFKNGKLVFAYDSRTFEVLGITTRQRPKE